jgi:hypothetical protein
VVEGRERRFITVVQAAVGRGKVRSSAHLWDIGINFRFKERENWSRAQEVCILLNSHSHRCGPVVTKLVRDVVWLIIISGLVSEACYHKKVIG